VLLYVDATARREDVADQKDRKNTTDTYGRVNCETTKKALTLNREGVNTKGENLKGGKAKAEMATDVKVNIEKTDKNKATDATSKSEKGRNVQIEIKEDTNTNYCDVCDTTFLKLRVNKLLVCIL